MNNSETVVALYDRLDNAHEAILELVAAGFSRDDISLVAHDTKGEYRRTDGDEDVSGGEGASFGAVVGGLTGVVAGLSTIIIPGIGPIIAAGPLVAMIGGAASAAVGAAVGAVTGGLTASLMNLGIPAETAEYYAESVRRGNAVVTVAASGDDATDAMNIMYRHHPVNVENRAAAWRKQGWQGFDPQANPYDNEALAKEREMYEDEPNTDTDDAVKRYPLIPPPIR